MRASSLVLVVCALATACGGGGRTIVQTRTQLSLCEPARAGFVVCGYPLEPHRASKIFFRATGAERVVTGPARASHGKFPSGYWRADRIYASPDRRMLLAQWSGECEAQETYLVPAAGGRPRAILPRAESQALGWSRDGRARILLPRIACGGNGDLKAGVYLVDPKTLELTLVRLVAPRPGGS